MILDEISGRTGLRDVYSTGGCTLNGPLQDDEHGLSQLDLDSDDAMDPCEAKGGGTSRSIRRFPCRAAPTGTNTTNTIPVTNKTTQNLKIIYSNVDQLPNKRDELGKLVLDQNPDIIQLTEILPKHKTDINSDIEFALPGYHKPFINKTPLRGIAVYIKENIDAQRNEELENCEFINESVFVNVKVNSVMLLVGCVYRSGSNDKETSTMHLTELLKQTASQKFDKIIINGDINYPKINWQIENNNSGCEEKFINCLRDLFLTQHIKKPTRHRVGQKSNILDLCITNDEGLISEIQHLPALGKSDHDVLIMSLDLPITQPCPQAPRFNYFKTDFAKFREYISSIDFSVLNQMTLEEAWNFFSKTIHTGIEKFVPLRKVKKKQQPIWMNRKAMKCIKKKYILYKRYRTSHRHYDYQKYIQIRNETKRQIRKAVKEYEKNLAKNFKIKPKHFWKYVNSKLKRPTGISNLKKPDGTLTESDKEKADVINNFFSTVFTQENTTNIPVLEEHNNNIYLSDIILTQEAVKLKLNKLDPNKAMGPDKIPAIILKELSQELSLPLVYIFNKSLSEGRVPSDWKNAEVTAIFKKGNKSEAGNYRPVSLTSIVCKILESFITDQIRNHMESKNLFTQCQHGFRQHRSCVTQLLEVLNDFTQLIENKDSIDVIYLDFSKAFDTVPHKRLINKLHAYGINGNLVQWIEDFLTDRKQRVRVNTSFSEYTPVVSGIPQGSILGPILFVIYINDLPEILESSCKIFADDTKLYGSPNDKDILQKDLLSLLEWSETWQIKFNINKCGILHIGTKNPKHDYFMNEDLNIQLNEVNSEKDVGVTFSNDLKFDLHINNVVNKANQMLGIIKRSFTYLDRDMFLRLYKGLVRPHLEYANIIWHPTFKRQSVMLENVQRRATKILNEIKDLEYKERLKYLKLPSIKHRQTRGDLIETYKIIHGFDNLKANDFFKLAPQNSKTRNHTLKLYKEYANTTARCNFFSNRVNNTWNSLSKEAKLAPDILTFKKYIDQELQNIMYDHD